MTLLLAERQSPTTPIDAMVGAFLRIVTRGSILNGPGRWQRFGWFVFMPMILQLFGMNWWRRRAAKTARCRIEIFFP